MWFQLSEEQYKTVVACIEEGQRNADSDAKEGIDGAEESSKEYQEVLDVMAGQEKRLKDPFRLIRAICEDNDWEEGNSPGNRIWSIAHNEIDPDTVDEP